MYICIAYIYIHMYVNKYMLFLYVYIYVYIYRPKDIHGWEWNIGCIIGRLWRNGFAYPRDQDYIQESKAPVNDKAKAECIAEPL